MNSYKKLCTEFYDLDKPHAPAGALAFYLRHAEKAAGPILEPMCGSGRFLLPLLERGLAIEGVDVSADMLRACRENGRRRGLFPVLYEQSVDCLDLPGRYHLVVIPASSFSLLTESARALESLRRLHAHMVAGAPLVLEVERFVPPPPQSEPWAGRWVERPDGARIVISWISRHEPGGRVSRSLYRYELIEDGRLLETELEDFDLRSYEPAEFRALLGTAGFTVVREFSAPEDIAYDGADGSLVFECVKP